MVITSLKAEWKPMIKVPEVVPSASFLADKSFLEQYNAVVDSSFKGNKALRVLNYAGGVVKGSNPFAVALVGEMVRPLGYSVATPAQLEQVLASGALSLSGQYEDTGLVLRSEENPNEYLAKNLANQVRARGINLRSPLVVALADVDVVNDQDSNYGLAFKLRDGARIIEAPILKKDGSFSSKDIDVETGLLRKLSNGDRTSYTGSQGLSGLCLSGGLILYSSLEDLAYSSGDGRVVLTCGKATSADFTAQLTKQANANFQKLREAAEKEYQTKVNEINALGERLGLK